MGGSGGYDTMAGRVELSCSPSQIEKMVETGFRWGKTVERGYEEPPRNSPRGSVLRARHGPYKCACVALSRGGRGCRKRYKRVSLLYISHEGHHCDPGAVAHGRAPPPLRALAGGSCIAVLQRFKLGAVPVKTRENGGAGRELSFQTHFSQIRLELRICPNLDVAEGIRIPTESKGRTYSRKSIHFLVLTSQSRSSVPLSET